MLKGRVSGALQAACQKTGVRKLEDLPADVRSKLAALPSTINEVDEAIDHANARIQLMGRADEQVLISPLYFLDPCLFPFYVVNVQLISLLRLLGIMGGVKGASSNWWTFCRELTTASVI